MLEIRTTEKRKGTSREKKPKRWISVEKEKEVQ